MKAPKLEKLFSDVCAVRLSILYIMFQPSELTTATKVLFILIWGLAQGKNGSVHKYKGFCICIAEKV